MPPSSAITVCLVEEARHGPFVLHAPSSAAGIEAAVETAAAAGFDAIEIFPPSAAEVPPGLGRLVAATGLRVAAVGTGAGWVRHRIHLCHPDEAVRRAAEEFIAGIVDVAAGLGAPAIVGSLQGSSGPEVPRGEALSHLADALGRLSARARSHGQVLLYEPLNRYESNLLNRQADAAAFLAEHGLADVRLLCDLFHMNIEEPDVAGALHACGRLVGHVHFADSNRRAPGMGHTPLEPVMGALEAIGYDGYLSAEVLPLPDAATAARTTIESFRRLVAV
jgi:sugar phosphate isomerase/epimerase